MSSLPVNSETASAYWVELYKKNYLDQRRIEMAQEAAGSFRKFIPLAWSQVMPSKAYIHNCWHIDAMADHLSAVADHQIQNLLMVVPPGSAKSSVTSVMFSAFMWIKHPKWRSVWASYDAGLSTRDSVACRDLLKSSWYQEAFHPQWAFKKDQDEKTYFYNTEKGFRMSTSVDGSGTGHRADLLGIDDALSTAARYSPATLEACIRWYENVWMNRLIDMNRGSRVVIGQRVADNDLIGHLIRRGGWEILHIPMEYNPTRSKVTSIGWKDPRKDAGELMFEPLFPREVVDQLKSNADVYATQYQGDPTVEGGGILKSHEWNYWQPELANLPPVRVKMPNGDVIERKAEVIPDQFDMELMSWDCTFKEADANDFVCGMAVAVRGPKRYIVDHDMRRLGIVDTMEAIRQMTGRRPRAHTKLVEDKANGTAVVEMLKREIPGLMLVNPEGGKVARASAVAPEVHAGNWYLPHPMIARWVGDPAFPLDGGFLSSTVKFPFAEHDDDVDSWSQSGIYIQSQNLGGIFGVSEKDIRVDPMAIDPKWPRMYAMAINWREFGAVWICRQPDTNQHYLYAEIFSPAGDPAHHATAIRQVTPEEWVIGYVHVTDEGRVERDGFRMIKRFKELGLTLQGVPGAEVAELMSLSEALRGGQLKVFGNCSRFFDQFRMFRRDDAGNLPKQGANVIRAAMVAWAAHSKMKGPPEPQKPDRLAASYSAEPQSGGWMGN